MGTIFGAGSLLPGCAKEIVLKPKEDAPPPIGEEKFLRTVCGMCPAGCGIRVRNVDGRPVGVSGIADHPVNQGGLCPKGAAILQELYHPDRLKNPLARKGVRGSGKWEAVSWEEAFKSLGEGISKARANGKLPLAALSTPGTEDIHREILWELAGAAGKNNLFTLRFPWGDLADDAYEKMHGTRNTVWNLTRAKLLVSFGFDWLQSHPSHVEAQRVFAELRRGRSGSRAHIVQVEPRFSVSAAKADEWIAVRPGTGGILALAVARRLIEEGAYDADFVRAHVRGFDEFKRNIDSFSIRRASEAAGVPEETLRLLCVKFLSLKPAAVIGNRGTPFDQMAVHSLNVILGNAGPGKPFEVGARQDEKAEDDPDFKELPGVLLVDRVNPLFTSPARWKKILEEAPLVATVSPFLTETAMVSDWVLPCHASLEQSHLSFHASMDGKSILNAARGAVAPAYDTKHPGDIFLGLLQNIQKKNTDAHAFDSHFSSRLRELGAEPPAGEDSADIWRESPLPSPRRSVSVLPSGKIELGELAGLASSFHWPADEDGDFPNLLQLFSPLAFSRGEGAHLPYLMSIAGPQSAEMWETWAEIHPDTARKHGIFDKDGVWIESSRGRIRAKARITPAAVPGVVSVPIGLGHSAYGRWAQGVGSNPLEIAGENETTRVRLTRA
ncbi:MAG: hypothetical protein A3A86_06155 [Elusimicrobia bacterium RIFCSPLOWO2_01_FULL_60_11]|nr:MAG: hypothetical protein A3A86_06155 [Elusimicrobia bacterium RIFCSPLOWO2_01_FULL_60_11]